MSRRTQDARPAVLRIDWIACDGRGLCAELLPELLELDPWGYPRPRVPGRAVPVPVELVGAAREAVRLCPVLALHLEPAPPRT